MPKLKENYDVVIIGSGLGGLMSAYILSRLGFSVCVLEKNAQIGGNLQTFKRDRTKFDTGVHYVGGAEKGQPLYPYLRYFNLLDNIDLIPLDKEGFDLISFDHDDVVYPHGMGYDRFIDNLAAHFPENRQDIEAYCELIQSTCRKFKLYNLVGEYEEADEFELLNIGAKEIIDGITENEKLRQVLAGSNMLYAGTEQSPFYIHALITNSYILSAYKLKHSDQMVKQLRLDIKAMGGDIFINAEVDRILNTAKTVEGVELTDGRIVKGNHYISNIHPTLTYQKMDNSVLRKSNSTRILTLPNSISVFILYIKFKPGAFPYANHNRYHFFTDEVWKVHEYTEDNWLKGIAMFNSPYANDPEHAETMCVMAYMRYDEVKQWEGTVNTTLSENSRGQDYEAFKEAKAQEILAALESVYPGIRETIYSYYTATPLTQRDYIGSAEGGIYGILRDYQDPIRSFIRARTKLKNLYFAGQNTVLHGVLGVTVSAVLAAQAIAGDDAVIDDILAAQKEVEA